MGDARAQKATSSAASPQSSATELPAVQTKTGGCPSCGSTNPDGAMFCGRCGTNLGAVRACSRCGAPVTAGGDICEGCGEWLLSGQCKFCYAPIESDAPFCPHCGNPQDGIECPHCHTKNIFDFCSRCNAPLTEGARTVIAESAADPEAQAFVSANQAVFEKAKAAAELDQQLAQLAQEEKEESPTDPIEVEEPKRFFSEEFVQRVMGSQAESQLPQTKQSRQSKLEQEARRRERIKEIDTLQRQKEKVEQDKVEAANQAEKAASALQKKQYTNPQEARRAANAVRPLVTLGWLCNYAGVVHNCPNECAEPQLGGRWLTE